MNIQAGALSCTFCSHFIRFYAIYQTFFTVISPLVLPCIGGIREKARENHVLLAHSRYKTTRQTKPEKDTNHTSKSGHNHALTHGKHQGYKQKQSDRTLSDVPHWDSTFPKKFYILTTQNSGTTLHTTIIKRFHKNLKLPKTWQPGIPSKEQIHHLGTSGKVARSI